MGSTRDYELKASLDDREVLEALKRIDANVQRIADQGDKSFQQLGKSAGASGVAIGALTGVVTAVTNKIIELGEEALRVFADIVKESLSLASGLETAETSLTGIFKGSEPVALAVMDRIRRKSLELGADLTEVAAAFLPKVENIEQFEKVGEFISSLARLDPAQGAAGARIALTEALTGDVVSLRKRFELDVGPIQEAQKQFGELEGLIIGLDQILAERGQDFENLSDTAAVAFGRAQEVASQLQTTLGEPLLDQIKEELNDLLGIFTEQLPDGTRQVRDEFVLIAGAIGDVLAMITELGGDELQGFLEGLDTEKILEFIQRVGEFFSLIDVLLQSLSRASDLFTAQLFGEALGGATTKIFDLNEALEAGIKLIGLFSAGIAGFQAATQGLAKGESLAGIQELFKGAALEELQRTNDLLAENEARIQGLVDATNDRRQSLEESNDADLAAANAMLAAKQAAEDAAAAQEEYEKALDKVNKARGEFDIDKERAFFDLQLKQTRALIDAEIDFAEKRADIARKNTQKIQDIWRNHYQKLEDAALDLQRKEQDIALENTRDQADLATEEAKKREQIEIDHRQRLEDIKRRFEFDAQEAIRANDAVAFLRIQRQAQFELETAEQQRQQEIDDSASDAQEKREKLALELQREIEDAKIANARKLEDLQINLAQQLEAQRIAYQRDLEAQAVAEQRKREEIQRNYDRQLEDFNRFWQRKLEDLQRNLARELQIIQQHEARIAALQANRRTRRIAPEVGESVDGVRAAPGVRGSGGRGSNRHIGGPVEAGQTYIIGKPGAEEAFTPRVSGYVSPLMLSNTPIQGQTSTTRIDSRQQNFDFGKLGGLLSPVALAQVEAKTLEILGIIEANV